MTHRKPTPDVGEFRFILFPTDTANVDNDALKKIFISMTGNDDYELIEKGGVTWLNGQEKPLRMFECIWNKTIPAVNWNFTGMVKIPSFPPHWALMILKLSPLNLLAF
jgi:hypothetical protein